MVRAKDPSGTAIERLREFGLRYPGAHTKSPWPGHLDLAVKDKTFAYLSAPGDPPRVSCKLPRSAESALSLPFTAPTPYGLGKSGWVSAEFPDDSSVPFELLREWIDESYRAQAPKRLSAGLPALSSEEPLALAAAASPVSKPRRSTKRRPVASVAPTRSAKRAPKRPATKAPAKAPARARASARAKAARGEASSTGTLAKKRPRAQKRTPAKAR